MAPRAYAAHLSFMGDAARMIVLTIAGSDSGGGAGIQADLKTFAAMGVYGTSVITAVTAQNTQGVRGWERVSPALVGAQIDAVAETCDRRRSRADAGRRGACAHGGRRDPAAQAAPYVLDPVMAATSGDALLTPDAISAIVGELFPLASLVTPNLDEVGAAARRATARRAGDGARRTHVRRGVRARAALVKGGHLAGDDLVDVLFDGASMRRFSHTRIATSSTHGTGMHCRRRSPRRWRSRCRCTTPRRAGALVRAQGDQQRRASIRHGPLNHLPEAARAVRCRV